MFRRCFRIILRLHLPSPLQNHREKQWETAVDLSSISKRRRRHGSARTASTNGDRRLHRKCLHPSQGWPRRPLRRAHPRGTRWEKIYVQLSSFDKWYRETLVETTIHLIIADQSLEMSKFWRLFFNILNPP